MVLSSKWRLQATKDLAEVFLRQHYPDEVIVFPVTWQRFLDLRRKSKSRGASKTLTEPTYLAGGLPFADVRRVNLVAPLVIVTMYQILEELAITSNQMSVPSIEQLQAAVRSCAKTFCASPQVVSEMVATLPPRLHRVLAAENRQEDTATEAMRKQTIRVDHNGQVFIDNDESFRITPAQAAAVFCQLIRNRRIHWLDGTVLFDAWARELPKDPFKTFSGQISKASRILDEHGAGLYLEPEKGIDRHAGSWQLRVGDGTQLSGTVFEAQSLVDEADTALSAHRLTEAARQAAAALDKDPTSIAAAALVLRTCGSYDLDAAQVQRLKDGLRTVQKFNRNVAGALVVLSEVASALRERWCTDMETFRDFLAQKSLESSSLCRAAELVLKEGRHLYEEETKLLTLDVLVQQMRMTSISPEDKLRLIQGNEIVTAVLRAAAPGCRKLFRLTPDLRETLSDRLVTIFRTTVCRAKKCPLDFKSISHLKGAWVLRLRREATEEMIEQTLNIERAVQKDMRKLMQKKAQLDKQKMPDTRIWRKLKWKYSRFIVANSAREEFLRWQYRSKGKEQEIDSATYSQLWSELLRIPVIPPTYSEGKRPPVPSDCGRVFQLNRSGCSGRIGA
jgi:hypothetical protein